ncbi:M4 family metallopeptidase [Longispora albida]|uniref:M4 family metallopeptidase n=1 Tax=Longispora albida TaxID=203523 RepID=UPI00037600AC|nr:M4 family metallopeptidase [Longispora albida]
MRRLPAALAAVLAASVLSPATAAAAPPAGPELVQLGKTGQTVRYGQTYRGVPVLGAQRLVHGGGKVTDRTVTGLAVSTQPSIGADQAARVAMGTVTSPEARRSARTAPAKLVVLPGGKGVLAWQVEVVSWDAGPVRSTVHVDAHRGVVVAQQAGRTGTSRTGRPGAALSVTGTPAAGTGVTQHGAVVPLGLTQEAGQYQLRDTTRKGKVSTYDAEGRWFFEFLDELPAGTGVAVSDTPEVKGRATESGAVDAHYGAAQVYSFYADRLGRDGIDGQGGPMDSVVAVSAPGGEPFVNAFWNGRYMVYGGLSDEYYSLAAGLDVVGHEMTHGVIERTANLVYTNQSGAMNEAIADYFGNAIDVTVSGTPMNHPDAGLLGERTCRAGAPRECAIRDLNDGRTTRDYIGVLVWADNGGVHLNSTIFGGALWDLRESIDPALADRIVYKALTEYLTPLATFVDGRQAVLSAAAALGAPLAPVHAAFDAHGIQAGWEKQLGGDGTPVLKDFPNIYSLHPSAAQGHFVVAKATFADPYTPGVYTGRTSGKGEAVRITPEGEYANDPATDGKTAVWTVSGQEGSLLRSRDLGGGPVREVWSRPDHLIAHTAVNGEHYAWLAFEAIPGVSGYDAWVKTGDSQAVNLTPEPDVEASGITLCGNYLGYVEFSGDSARPVVYNMRTGKKVYIDPGPGARVTDVAITEGYVVFGRDTNRDSRYALSRAPVNGGPVTDILPESPEAPRILHVAATDGWITFQSFERAKAGIWKLRQVGITGGTPVLVSCGQGEQAGFTPGEGRQVLWYDGSAGRTDLVTRKEPAAGC